MTVQRNYWRLDFSRDLNREVVFLQALMLKFHAQFYAFFWIVVHILIGLH